MRSSKIKQKMEEKTNMNKYKIEFKQTFKKEVTVYADDENAAMNIVEQTFLKTDLLDDSTRDLEKIETKIIEKNNEKVENNFKNLEENQITLDKEDLEYLDKLADEVEGDLNEIKDILFENEDNLEGIDIIKLNELEDEMEEKLDEIREVIVEIKEENL